MSAKNSETGPHTNPSVARVQFDGLRLPAKIFLFCLSTEVTLVLLDAYINYFEGSKYETIQELFDIGKELSLASWFMVTQTLIAALMLWVIFLVQKDLAPSRGKRLGWGFLAGFFTYLAIDDGAFVHERLGTVFSDAYGSADANSDGVLGHIQSLFPSYDWQLVILPFLAGAGVFMLFFLWREMNTLKERLLMLTAATCMAFAVGLDFIEGLPIRHPLNLGVWFAGKFDIHLHTAAHFYKSLEEFLEMLAISILLVLFLRHLIRLSGAGLLFSFNKNCRTDQLAGQEPE